MCATENFTNRYTSLNFNKSVALYSLYQYRFVFALCVCATKNVPNRYIPNDLRYILTFSMLPPLKKRPYLFFYRFWKNIVSSFRVQWATTFSYSSISTKGLCPHTYVLTIVGQLSSVNGNRPIAIIAIAHYANQPSRFRSSV